MQNNNKKISQKGLTNTGLCAIIITVKGKRNPDTKNTYEREIKIMFTVEVFTKNYGWCLDMVVCGGRARAEEICEERKAMFPNKEFRVFEEKAEECWWNDPFLVG